MIYLFIYILENARTFVIQKKIIYYLIIYIFINCVNLELLPMLDFIFLSQTCKHNNCAIDTQSVTLIL